VVIHIAVIVNVKNKSFLKIVKNNKIVKINRKTYKNVAFKKTSGQTTPGCGLD
jgi:hypothetical protein